jgi:hypothetical protein
MNEMVMCDVGGSASYVVCIVEKVGTKLCPWHMTHDTHTHTAVKKNRTCL